MRSSILLCIICCVMPRLAAAQQAKVAKPSEKTQASASTAGFAGAKAKAERNLQTALDQHGKVMADIAKLKIPLIQEIDRWDNDVAKLNKELSEYQRAKLNRSRDLLGLDREVKVRQVEIDFVTGLLRDFSGSMPSRLHISENQVYESRLKEVRDKTEGGKLTPQQEIDERVKVIALSLERLEKVIGGDSFPGYALGESGANVKGNFALMGPSAFFVSQDRAVGGVTSMVVNQLLPSAIHLGPSAAKGIGDLIGNGIGSVPVDATQGKAIKVEMEKETLVEHISHADKVGYVTVVLGLIALAFALFKLVEIVSTRVPSPTSIHSIVDKCQTGTWKDAHASAAKYRGMAGDLIKLGVNKFETPHNVYEELLSEKLLSQRPKLERFLPFLAVTATAAPLMGLLGTVTGMIMTFKSITMFGNSDPKTVSSGISEALVATEIGLVVAISALIFHGFLLRMAKSRVARLEGIAMAFLNGNLDRPSQSHARDDSSPEESAFANSSNLQPAR